MSNPLSGNLLDTHIKKSYSLCDIEAKDISYVCVCVCVCVYQKRYSKKLSLLTP